ncbi:MAG: hypothetical protein ACOY45_06580 [Pseudomonadota bacterium]
MHALRAFFLRHRTLSAMTVIVALCMKIMVPTGFMIGQNSTALTLEICDAALGNHAIKQLVIPMKSGEQDPDTGKQGKGDCPFASLSMASTGGADPTLLLLALAFILALGLTLAPVRLPKPLSNLRPPLRGPPAHV